MLEYILIGISALVLVLIVVLMVLLIVKRIRNKPTTEGVSIDLDQFLQAVGGRENITDVKMVNNRVKLTLKDIKVINQAALNNIVDSAFITGAELKVLVKNNPNALYEALAKKDGN